MIYIWMLTMTSAKSIIKEENKKIESCYNTNALRLTPFFFVTEKLTLKKINERIDCLRRA